MGRRRVRLLKQYISNGKYSGKEWKIIGTDFSEVRRKEAEALLGIETYMGLEDAIQKNSVDCAIISSPPLSHSSIIKECLKQKLHVFTELNLVDEGYNENIAMAENQRNVLLICSKRIYVN